MTPTLEGRRLLVIVPPARFDEAVFYQTWQLLSDEGAWLMLASDSPTGIAVGEDGNLAHIATQVASAPLSDFDGIVVIGGPDADAGLSKVAGFHQLIVTAKDRGTPIGALAGAEHAVPGAITGSLRNLPRFIAELAIQVGRHAPRESGAQIPV